VTPYCGVANLATPYPGGATFFDGALPWRRLILTTPYLGDALSWRRLIFVSVSLIFDL